MKKITMYFSCLILSALLLNITYAQTSSSASIQDDPRVVTDKTKSDRLQKDWVSRNPGLENELVQWYGLGDGYYGYYNTGNVPYMSFYDKQGNFVQSYKKSDWNRVPPELKNSYDVSNYKNSEVTGYWESSDPGKKGYYLELKDDQGKVSRVWVDDKRQFSSTFPKGKPKLNN